MKNKYKESWVEELLNLLLLLWFFFLIIRAGVSNNMNSFWIIIGLVLYAIFWVLVKIYKKL